MLLHHDYLYSSKHWTSILFLSPYPVCMGSYIEFVKEMVESNMQSPVNPSMCYALCDIIKTLLYLNIKTSEEMQHCLDQGTKPHNLWIL